MQIVVVGLNQRSAPVAVRERLAFVPGELHRALTALRNHVAEGFILSTCNRVELYAVAGHADTGSQLLCRFLAEARAFPAEQLRPLLYAHGHEDAVAHLFRVASGMDSMVLGESEVLSQVRTALDAAQATGMLGPVVRRLGSAAIGAARRVRSQTAIGRNPLSVVTLALQAAATRGALVSDGAVLVLGAGETAETVLRHLARTTPRSVTVISRRYERAAELAARHRVAALPMDSLGDALREASLVIGCTSAPDLIVRRDALASARRDSSHALLCIDLGVPRDIDAAVRGLDGVTLIDLDELQAVATENRQRRSLELEHAERLIAIETERFMDWWRSRQVVPTIAALRAYAADIRDAEVAHALARLGDVSERDAFVIRALAQRIIGKILHRPLTVLKADAEGANMAQILCQLFQLEQVAPDAPTCPVNRPADARTETSAT